MEKRQTSSQKYEVGDLILIKLKNKWSEQPYVIRKVQGHTVHIKINNKDTMRHFNEIKHYHGEIV